MPTVITEHLRFLTATILQWKEVIKNKEPCE
jgi:hypothetical protein